MSPITVFTVVNCPHSIQVKSALEDYKLPYSEISLSEYPQKRKELLQLTGHKVSVPQVFLHSRWIGGVDATLGFLRDLSSRDSRWFSSATEQQEQESPLEKLERHLGIQSTASNIGGQDPRFMVPIIEEEEHDEEGCCSGNCDSDDCCNDDDSECDITRPLSDETSSVSSSSRITPTNSNNPNDTIRIRAPDGSELTVMELTERLKQILVYGKRRYNFTTYKNCCTAEEIVDSLCEAYFIDRKEGEDFGKLLNQHNIIHHVCNDHMFQDTKAYFFRLQCYHTPFILNSYRLWPSSSQMADPNLVMQRVMKLYRRVEEAVVGPDGCVNYRVAYMCSDFPAFEDAVCELQRVDLSNLEGAAMVAFAVNIYNMMIQYAFMKVGIPVGEADRTSLLNQVRFNVAGYVFSLQEWRDGVLRGNRKSPITKTFALGKKDPRLALAAKVGDSYAKDCRLHFAVQCWSRSRRSPPVKTFTAAGLDEELGFVAHAFCEDDDNVAFNANEKKMRLAPVFRLYKPDFLECGRTVPRVVLCFLHGPRREKLARFLNNRGHNRSLKMSSRVEDWTLGISDFVIFVASTLNPNKRRIGKCVRSTTRASSYRPDASSRTGSSCRDSSIGDASSICSSSIGGGSFSRFLPAYGKLSGGRARPCKTDSIPKSVRRRNFNDDASERTLLLDEIGSNASSISVNSNRAA